MPAGEMNRSHGRNSRMAGCLSARLSQELIRMEEISSLATFASKDCCVKGTVSPKESVDSRHEIEGDLGDHSSQVKIINYLAEQSEIPS